MTKRRKWFLMAVLKVCGVMLTTITATVTVMGPNESLSGIQVIIISAAVLGNGALTWSGILAETPVEPDPLSTKEVRQILGVPKKKARDPQDDV